MPLVKVIRHGQITLPKQIRDALGIREGDLLDVRLTGADVLLRPKAAVDREVAGERLFQMLEEIREGVKGADPAELDDALAEAVAEAKKATAGRLKARRAG